MMITTRLAITVLVAIYVGVGAVLVTPIAFLLLTYGCTAEDDQFAAALATLSILESHPADATPQRDRGSTCDNDDRIVSVWQSYRSSGSRADALSFYRDAAIMDGWKPVLEEGGEETGCFIKSFGRSEVHLSVSMGEAVYGDGYDVKVSSSLDGGGWC
ncbi:hypothetical protein [Streptosporangium sp. KLBMP 9127]|nr:hypothetical protein [Streptosporangium sp. KLBMP 9127]